MKEIFISHAFEDREIADKICTSLESKGISCWIAPRDIIPGENYAQAIMDGLDKSKVFVLVFSESANKSPHIIRELEKSVNNNAVIIPFIVDKVKPDPNFEYFMGPAQRLDATTPPLEDHIERLVNIISTQLSRRNSLETVTDTGPGKSISTPPPQVPKPPEPKKRIHSSLLLLGLVVVIIIAVFVFPSIFPRPDTDGPYTPVYPVTNTTTETTPPTKSSTSSIPPNTVQGRVLWNEQPVSGAEVVVTDEYYYGSTHFGSTKTDFGGFYSISGIPEGRQVINVFGPNLEEYPVSEQTPFTLYAGIGTRAEDTYLRKGFNPIFPSNYEIIHTECPVLEWDYPGAFNYEVRVHNQTSDSMELHLGSEAGERIPDYTRTPNSLRQSNTIGLCLGPGEFTWEIIAYNSAGHPIADTYMKLFSIQIASGEIL